MVFFFYPLCQPQLSDGHVRDTAFRVITDTTEPTSATFAVFCFFLFIPVLTAVIYLFFVLIFWFVV